MDQDRRPVQDIAGVSGGGLEEDRDRNPLLDEDRSVADDDGVKKPVGDLNKKPVSGGKDSTRTITK
jgi:hypothetical protein